MTPAAPASSTGYARACLRRTGSACRCRDARSARRADRTEESSIAPYRPNECRWRFGSGPGSLKTADRPASSHCSSGLFLARYGERDCRLARGRLGLALAILAFDLISDGLRCWWPCRGRGGLVRRRRVEAVACPSWVLKKTLIMRPEDAPNRSHEAERNAGRQPYPQRLCRRSQ